MNTKQVLTPEQIIAVISALSLQNKIPGLNIFIQVFGNIKAVDMQVTFNNSLIARGTAYQDQNNFEDDLLKMMQDVYLVIASKSENLNDIVIPELNR